MQKLEATTPARRAFLVRILVLIVVFTIGYGLGISVHQPTILKTSSATTSTDAISFDRLQEVWDTLQKEYVNQPLNKSDAVYGAIHGMVDSLKDPYTVFFTPDESKSFQDEIGGVFEGIGAEIGIKNDQLVIIAPLPDSPAEKAGLKAGDMIFAIDTTATQGVALDDAVKKIRGAQGTKVALTIKTGADGTPRDVLITRASITVKSVQLSMTDDHIGILKLSYFGPQTEKEFTGAVNQFLVQNGKGLVLDLRSDPGGFLDTAVSVVGQFVDSGSVVVKEKFVDGTENEHKTNGNGKLKGIPVVVLIDEGSASASEIVAGALQDYGIATLVGTKSYGKGSVQQVEQFKDGSSLKVTIAKWFTPKGRSINQQGIVPDVEVQLTKEQFDKNQDPQQDKALEVLRSKLKQ